MLYSVDWTWSIVVFDCRNTLQYDNIIVYSLTHIRSHSGVSRFVIYTLLFICIVINIYYVYMHQVYIFEIDGVFSDIRRYEI